MPAGHYDIWNLVFNRKSTEILYPHSCKLRKETLKSWSSRGTSHTVEIKDGWVYRRIWHVDSREYDGPVYNLEVDGEHSYIVASAYAVSNCEFVYLSYGVYRTAAQRVVRYFLTNIELQDASDDEKEKWDKFLNDELRILNVLAMAGDNFMAYGNEFASVIIPFRRYLRCKKCSTEHPIKKVAYTWNGADLTFTAKCKCGHEGVFERVDRVSVGQDPLKIKHWPVHEIRLLYHPIQDKIIYLWEIPAWFK